MRFFSSRLRNIFNFSTFFYPHFFSNLSIRFFLGIFFKRQAKTNNLKNDIIILNGRQQKRDSCITHSETRYQGHNTLGYFPVEIGALIFALMDFTSDPVVEILHSNAGDMD